METSQNILIISLLPVREMIERLGIVKSIREKYPQDRITWLVQSDFEEIASQSCLSDFVISGNCSLIGWPFLLARLKKYRSQETVDLIFDLTDSFFSNWILRSYFDTPSHKPIWGKSHPKGFLLYRSGQIEPTVMPLKIQLVDLSFYKRSGKNFDQLPDRFVLLCPGSGLGETDSIWPVANYVKVARVFLDEHIPVVLIGSKKDKDVAGFIKKQVPGCIDLVNKIKLTDIPAVACRASAIIGNDTELTYFAALTQTKTIILSLKKQSHIPLPHILLLNGRVMGDISVDVVLENLPEVLPTYNRVNGVLLSRM